MTNNVNLELKLALAESLDEARARGRGLINEVRAENEKLKSLRKLKEYYSSITKDESVTMSELSGLSREMEKNGVGDAWGGRSPTWQYKNDGWEYGGTAGWAYKDQQWQISMKDDGDPASSSDEKAKKTMEGFSQRIDNRMDDIKDDSVMRNMKLQQFVAEQNQAEERLLRTVKTEEERMMNSARKIGNG